MNRKSWTGAAALAFLLAAGGSAWAADMQKASLYERLGGQPAITAVVDEFISRVAADARINARFANANIPMLKQHLVELISAGSGGNVKYTGKDMRTAHEGMHITDGDFGALVEDLVGALDKFKVPEKEKGDLLAVLGPMKGQIVGH